MSRLTTFVMVMVGLSLLFYLFGIIELNDNPIIKIVKNPENMSTGEFWFTILGGLSVVGAIVVGAFTKNVELSVMTPIVAYVASVLWGFLDVYNKLAAESEAGKIIGLILFAPLLFLFVLILLDWWRGRE